MIRMLRGVYNERPPVARCSVFSDAGKVAVSQELVYCKSRIAIIMYSKQQFVYASAYRWTVNTLRLTKSSLGVACLISLVTSRAHLTQPLT